MNLHLEQQNSIEDVILDNYVNLWRHIKGEERLRAPMKQRPTTPLEVRRLNWAWLKEIKTCEMCKVVKFNPRYYGQRYCGNQRKKEGCAYLKYLQGIKNSREIRIKNGWERKR